MTLRKSSFAALAVATTFALTGLFTSSGHWLKATRFSPYPRNSKPIW